MGSVPLYYHIPVVLALLALQCSTVYWAMRRVRDLQAALVAKKVLLGESNWPTIMAAAAKQAQPQSHWMAAADTLTVQGPKGDWYVEIETSHPTTLKLKSVQVS